MTAQSFSTVIARVSGVKSLGEIKTQQYPVTIEFVLRATFLGSAISPSKKAEPSLKKLREVRTGIIFGTSVEANFQSLKSF